MTKILPCFLLFGALVFEPGSTAQSHTSLADSLWNVWGIEEESDSSKLNFLISFNRENYVFNYPDSGIYFADITYEFATEKNLLFAQSEALNIKGICYTLIDDYDKALSCYAQSLLIDEEIQDLKSIANKLNNIGIIYKNLGNYVRAADYYSRALKLSIDINQPRIEALALSNLGTLMIKQGLYNESLYYIVKSLEIRKAIQDKKGILISYANLGEAYKQLHENDLSLRYLDSALVLSELLNNTHYKTTALFNIADCYRNMGDYAKALDNFVLISQVYSEMKNVSGYAVCLHRIADIYYINGDFEKALGIALQAYQLESSIKSTVGLVACARLCSMGYSHSTHLDSAKYYLDGMNQLLYDGLRDNYFNYSEQEKEDYQTSRSYYFDLNHDFALTFHDTFPEIADTALNIALMNKGLSLKSTTWLRKQILSSDDSLLITEYNDWLKLKKEIADQRNKGEENSELERLANEKEKALYKNSSSFADFIKQLRPDWRAVRDILEPGEAAVEFVHYINVLNNKYDVNYAAYIITPGCQHPFMVEICTEDSLKKILGITNGNNLDFVNKTYGTRQSQKTSLYETIWRPLEPHLIDVKNVYYSPDGLLHKVSFAAISKSQDVFLSDIYNFRQMGSTGNLAFENKTKFGELENFLLMGGIRYNSDSSQKEVWNYLPGSLAETESIRSLLLKKKYGMNYFHGNHASEAVFKEKITSSSIVHIATHGFFFPDPEQLREEMNAEKENENQELKFRGTTNYANWSFVNNTNPLMRSGIVLANANDVWSRDPLADGEDGILTAQEVSNLDLRNTKLVVLSACETGLGDIKGSEGVFGLQRAFKMAGVKYLIMSLWQVPDKETSEFMILFYKNLIKLKDIPTAFQKTQKVMREKYDPYYWGAFVLIE